MKTKSNLPLSVLEVKNIKKLKDGEIDLLECGDYVIKLTNGQKHAYKVTYKKDKAGICLTYMDASVIETQSYDYIDGHWVYNSEDKTELPVNEGDLVVNDLEVKGDLSVTGKINNEENPSVKPLYFHPISIYKLDEYVITMIIINTSSTAFTTSTLIEYLKNATQGRYLINGAIKLANSYLSPSYVAVASSGAERGNLIVYGVDSVGTSYNANNTINFETILSGATSFNDEVNKIN